MKNIYSVVIALLTIYSCSKNPKGETPNSESADTIVIKTKKLSKRDSLMIYTSIRNQQRIKDAQNLLDSLKINDPEKYENIKVLVNDSYYELFKTQLLDTAKVE